MSIETAAGEECCEAQLEVLCSADLCYDTLNSQPKKPVGDQYADFDKFRQSGAPLPLPDRPIIHLIHERQLTLSWKPSVPIGPRNPVTYHVEIGPDSITGYPKCKVKLYKTGGRWSRPAA